MWAIYALTFPVVLPVYLFLTLPIVAFEKSGRYVEAAAVTVAALVVLDLIMVFPDHRLGLVHSDQNRQL